MAFRDVKFSDVFKEYILREKCPNTEFFLVHNFPLSYLYTFDAVATWKAFESHLSESRWKTQFFGSWKPDFKQLKFATKCYN